MPSTSRIPRSIILPVLYSKHFDEYNNCLYCNLPLRHEMHAYNHYRVHHAPLNIRAEGEGVAGNMSYVVNMDNMSINQKPRFFYWSPHYQRWVECVALEYLVAKQKQLATAYTKQQKKGAKV